MKQKGGRYLSRGSYGCVIKPAIPCPNTLKKYKDIDYNKYVSKIISKSDNELNNEIQLISNSRDVLHSSKILIEKNMNEIMMNLLQCEYTISNRIKQINNLLINKIKIAPENDIKSVIRTFKNSIDVHYENLLYEIYRFGWDNHKIDLEDKTWELNGKLFIKFKFYKKYTDVIISDIDISIIDIEKTKYKQKKDGIHIKLNPESFELIKKICN